MVLENLSLFELYLLNLLTLFFIFIFLFILLKFEWFWKEIREISGKRNIGGYLKLIQILFIITLLILFVLTFIYFWRSDDKISPIEIIFTVIVGWMGLIIGRFFGERAMEISTEQIESIEAMQNIINNYEDRINEYEKITLNYQEQINNLINHIEYLENKLKKK